MKKFLSTILTVTMITALLTACTAETTKNNDNNPSATENITEQATEAITEQPTEENSIHPLYFKDSSKSSKVTATFFNSVSGKSEEVEMTKFREDTDGIIFSCEGDCSVYNMAYVTYGDKKTLEFAFNKCTSGWHKEGNYLLPYTEGEQNNSFSKCDEVTLNAGEYDKNIHIWKPDNYDASSKEKYSTVYVLDAEIFEHFAMNHVQAMMSVTDKKAIVVTVDNVFARDYELVPEIGVSRDEKSAGELQYDSMNGSEFAVFMAETLVPYIQQHYNVYTDALHTAITGASLGGLETFYITMEYPDVFGTLGAFSPSFWEYDEATWKKYLSDKKFNADSPLLYFYTGPVKLDTDPDVTNMRNRLKDMGYPQDKLILHLNEKGVHKADCWSNMFPEFLTAMCLQRVELLQK